MPAHIKASIEFWDKQQELDAAAARAPKGPARTKAQAVASEHKQAASEYIPLHVTHWCKNHDITDLPTDAQIIAAVVEWIADYLYIRNHQEEKFREYAEKYGLDEAIAWHADDVAMEAGHNKTKTCFIKTVQYLATETPYAVTFINSVIQAGDEDLRQYAAQSVNTSTSAGHNLVNTYKHEGRRTALRDILSACDFLRQLVQIW